MTTARQIIALLDSHNQGDKDQFLSIALQVAAAEARRGHPEIANELKALVADARKKEIPSVKPSSPGTSATHISKPRGELENLLIMSSPKTLMRDIVLDDAMMQRLTKVIHQQYQREKLHHHNLAPNSRLLLVGPPGSGKTLTASVLAGELKIPLFTIRLESVITRFMGETASKLRLIFDQISTIRGVYLFDEFDAIGGRRSSSNDVGEMRRVLNSFLQFFEEKNSTDSLVICTTNHPELLDKALFRRFDEILDYKLPDTSGIKTILSSRLSGYIPKRMSWTQVIKEGEGLSQADLAKAANEVIKTIILENNREISAKDLSAALAERHRLKNIDY